MKQVTVFTPTYNRKECLKVLYNSLCKQTNNNFLWLIVDDGSTDNTEEIINSWKKEKKVEIVYVKQKNSGKYKAVNTGIINCNTEMFLFIDSDDFLVADAIEKFLLEWNKVRNVQKIAGVVGRRKNREGKIIGKKLNFDKVIINENKLLKKYGYFGDTCRMYKTNILKENLYPNIEEKFIPEHVMFSPINDKYNLLFINEPFSISEYLEGGYTFNYKRLLNNNQMGHLLGLNAEINVKNKGLIHNIRYVIAYTLWAKNNNIEDNFKNCRSKMLYILLYPISLFLYSIDYPRWYNSNDKIKRLKTIKTKLENYVSFVKSIRQKKVQIKSAEETIDYILNNQKSLIRLGDGEFNFFRKYGVHYQKYDEEISLGLKEIINEYNENSNYLLCVPKYFFETNGLNLLKKRKYFMCWSYPRYYFKKFFNKKFLYGDAFCFAKENKEIYSNLFKNEEIENVIFVHNNKKYAEIFGNAYNKKIIYIKIPEKNSFSNYNDILEEIIKKYNENLKVMVVISARS